MSIQHFVFNSANGESWQIDDPLAWCLANADEPILERASTGLDSLSAEDHERIIRLVARRCSIHFIAIDSESQTITVQYWVKPADLRPFLKAHGLARQQVRVSLFERKHGVIILTNGNYYLYGEPVYEGTVDDFRAKWQKRDVEETADWEPASESWSNFCWEGVEAWRIPWAVLKVTWHQQLQLCPNCDCPIIVFQFGVWRYSLFNQTRRIRYLCLQCKRQFQSLEEWNDGKWMLANLTPDVMPQFKRDPWGTLAPWQPDRQ